VGREEKQDFSVIKKISPFCVKDFDVFAPASESPFTVGNQNPAGCSGHVQGTYEKFTCQNPRISLPKNQGKNFIAHFFQLSL